MKAQLKTVFILAGLGMAIWLLVLGIQSFTRSGDTGNRVWFYDESEKKLYPMPVTAIPPDRGIGGPSDDGERAYVVTTGGNRHDRSQWRIAYLQKYTPGLKKTLEDLIIARAAHRIFDGSVPSRTSDYFQTNTLVKRVDDTEWYASNSEEGQNIQSEWRSWNGSDDSPPAVCPVE